MAGELQQVFGTPQTVIDSAVDIASGNFGGAPAAEFNNTNDSAVPNAPYAVAMGQFPDWAGAPTAGGAVELWLIRKNIDGTADGTGAPSGTASNGAQKVGEFVLYATDELQRQETTISLLGIRYADFYVKNNSGQVMNNDGGTNCVVKITPFTLKPAA